MRGGGMQGWAVELGEREIVGWEEPACYLQRAVQVSRYLSVSAPACNYGWGLTALVWFALRTST